MVRSGSVQGSLSSESVQAPRRVGGGGDEARCPQKGGSEAKGPRRRPRGNPGLKKAEKWSLYRPLGSCCSGPVEEVVPLVLHRRNRKHPWDPPLARGSV